MSQQKRQQALDGFKSGTYNILVATDIAARGIDVSNISHVINFDMPENKKPIPTEPVEPAGPAKPVKQSPLPHPTIRK